MVDISVIIPTKNEDKYLKKTIKQFDKIKKKFSIEVIVSDGNSSDDTKKIAKKYADRLIQEKKGKKQNIAIGRNLGAKSAKGKILFHTDADVIIDDIENFFKRVKEIFEDKDIIALTTKIKVYPNERRISDILVHAGFNFSIKYANYLGSFLGKGECQIVRASAFRRIKGYDEKTVVGEDCNLFYRLNKKGKIHYASDLTIYHSSRRFRKEGYLKVLLIYIREGLSLLLRGKSYLSEWKPVR